MVGHELWLPEPAIERIQDFLDTKRAAKTMILSKSWHNVWLLRPNLVFNHYDHISHKHDHLSKEAKREIYAQQMKQFLEFADNTLNRYEKSNLKIKRFRLSFYRKYFPYGGTWDYSLQHTDLILRALKLGATHITFHLNYCYNSGTYVLPDEVFEFAETLTVIKCGINPNLQLTCSRLRSLSLDEFEFPNDLDSISNILLSCPLLQELSLYHHLSLHKPCKYYYDNYPTNDTGYITKPLTHLTTLVLKYVYFDMLFLGDLSSKFPILKDLTLLMSLKKHQEDIRISSTSLERLYFKIKNSPTCIRLNHPYKRQRVTLDFPSIRKFTYMGSVIPLLSLESNSKGWESHVSIRRRHKHLTASWFRRLSDLLTKLRPSKVFLSLRVRPVKSFDYEVGDIQGLPTSKIENLIINYKELPSLFCYALLDGFFRICHPKLITQCVSKCFRVKKKHIERLGHILLNGLLLNHEKTMLTRSQFMYGLSDLKEARAQIIDKAALISTRRDVYLQLDALLDHLKSAKGKREVRFHLNWERTTTSTRGNQPYSSS